MAYLPNQKELDDVITGKTSSIPLSSGGVMGEDSGGGGGSTAPAEELPRVFRGDTTTSLPRVSFSSLDRGVDEATRGLDRVVSDFYSGAGASRTFGPEEQLAITRAISGEAPIEGAVELATARYTGPAGLPEDELSGFEAGLGDTRQVADTLATGRGLVSWERRRPGLTPGEALFEAKRNYPETMSDAVGLGRSVRAALGDIASERESASAFGAQRAEEEALIRDQSREFLAREEEARMADLGARAGVENQRAAEIADAWAEFQETGNIGAIIGLADEDSQGALGQFAVGLAVRERAAQALYDEIVSRPEYSAIKDIPVGRLLVFPDGIERVAVEIDGQEYPLLGLRYGHYGPPGMTTQEIMAMGELLAERQAELEMNFSPATGRSRNIYGNVTNESRGLEQFLDLDQLAQQGFRGQYSDVLPLYAAELGLNPMRPGADPSAFVEYTEAPQATPGSVATESEADALNRIYDILGRQGDFVRSDRPTAGISTTDEQAAAYSEGERDRYMEALRSLVEAERTRQGNQQAVRAEYESDWWDDMWPALIPLFPFAPAALISSAAEDAADSEIGSGYIQGAEPYDILTWSQGAGKKLPGRLTPTR